MIELTISKADAQASGAETLTTGMLNVVFVHFNLSEHWDNLSKTAVFTNGIKTVDVLEEEWNTENTCRIPPEVLEEPWRVVKVGLMGTEGQTLVLPAVMTPVGRVRPGTDPSGDPSTDPDLPVWEQLRNRVQAVEDKVEPGYTTLTKPEGKLHTTVRVALHGLADTTGCPELHVYTCQRRRRRLHYWRHPDTWNSNASTGSTKMGYGLIADRDIDIGGKTFVHYPDIPEWMQNNGFLETVFPITQEVLTRGYIDIDLTTWLVPLVKPIGEDLDWTKIGLMGLQKDGDCAPLLFQFRIMKNGREFGTSRDTLAVGFRAANTPCPDVDGDGDARLNGNCIYSSIR